MDIWYRTDTHTLTRIHADHRLYIRIPDQKISVYPITRSLHVSHNIYTIWYKRACIRQTTRQVHLALDRPSNARKGVRMKNRYSNCSTTAQDNVNTIQGGCRRCWAPGHHQPSDGSDCRPHVLSYCG